MNIRHGLFAFVIAAVLTLAACSGGGGGGGGGVPTGGGGSGAPPANVAGDWTVTDTSTTNNCGESVGAPYRITIAQSGSSITVTTPAGVFNGSIDGNVVAWSGSYPEDGGTTTITSLTATVSGSTFSGTSNWAWTDGSSSCSGTSSFSGSLIAGTAPTTFTIGGTISGLSGTVVLRNNGGDNLTRSVNGSFAFSTAANAGAGYNVTVLTQPAGQTCSVANGTGTATANVTNISVTCSATTFTLTTATSGSGSVTRNPSQTSYAAGTPVQLTAVPQPGNAFSFWSGGWSGSQNPVTVTVNSNLSITGNFVVSTSTLTVVKAGLGAGTVTATGINCGSDCTEPFGSGQQVVLTATPATGSSFGSWTGCDNVNTNQCTVAMNASRTVTAAFDQSLSLSSLNVSVPATDTDGNYSVTATPGGGALVSTVFFLQEASSLAFVNPTQSTYINSTYPRVISFSGKADGTYCYRAAFTVPSWGIAACVTVSRPTTAVLRISNPSSYDLIDIRLNSVQQATYPNGIAAGSSYDFVFNSGGTVSYALGNGFYGSGGSRDVWFTLNGQATLTAGQTTTVTFNNPTIGQLLTGFTTARNWEGVYYTTNLSPFYARYRFTSTGGWQLFDSTAPCFGGATCSFTQVGSGTARLVSWPRYSSIVTFDFGAGTTAASIGYPFGSFLYRNGPSSWPLIEYIRQ